MPLLRSLLALPFVAGCGAPPPPAPPKADPGLTRVGHRPADAPDDCTELPGQPPPEPLRIAYQGVAMGAPCQRAVYTIMGGLTHFLGVQCNYCHLEPDYAADTHNKQVANWMARELIPRLQKRTASASGQRDVWCQDCHAGKAKFLGNPRRRDFAVEWMTTHLSEDFSRAGSPGQGAAPRCRDCHGGDLGSPGFRAKVILTELDTGAVLPPPGEAPALPSAPATPSAAPTLPDFGGR